MSDSKSTNSCVETPTAPEWLSKLENRREMVTLNRSKLGHESGAGAPCTECKDKCPGLDLHFWRKVCRNCKCRKNQHMCTDDDATGWAQFEILGQIRAKPAYIKIKALASQPVQLEWVPPNAAPDVVTDYMEKLGPAQIPVAGSDAAHRRKQQLEFQVPPHDLDAALCDGLSETEARQLQQYVQKLREQCVGQGIVVRVGNRLTHGHVEHVANPLPIHSEAANKTWQYLGLSPVADATLTELLSNPKVSDALSSQVNAQPKLLVAFSEPLTDSITQFEEDGALQARTKEKLLGISKPALQSLVTHGVIYDKVLGILQDKNLNISRDPKLGPIAEFRKEYVNNPQFRAEISTICPQPMTAVTPLKSSPATPFNSPLPLKNPVQARFGAQMRQDTPMRRVKFGGVSTIVYDCGLPANIDYERDPVFAQIIQAEPLKQALMEVRAGRPPPPVVIACSPAAVESLSQLHGLSPTTKGQLQEVGVDRHMLHSAVANGPYYDRLFRSLQDKGIEHDKCQLLQPIKQVHDWLLNDDQLLEDIDKVFHDMANASRDIAYAKPYGNLPTSQSNDSGFHSKPSTPGYGSEDLTPGQGKFTTIPGIEDMNMYPNCAGMPEQFQQLRLQGNEPSARGEPVPSINCGDCNQPIDFGEVAVKAERAGKEIAWHPGCFKCHTCRELLADLVYFFHQGQVYCGRDLAIKLKIPRCKACDELIFTKEYTAAESATYHIKHFCCYQCDEPLAGQQYIPDEKSNMPLCLQCYDKFFAVNCRQCQQPIGPADQGVAWGDIHWHGQCFVCAGVQCSKSLIGGRFCVKQDLPFCSPTCVRSRIP
ncbi:uncharacterized protein LOC117592537 isoform X1 [Drosophila guanche]|uniref:Blast:Transposable element Tc3 transposase n=1 Tax=Drosophila guanche TaxID=7266 RepID=A0A3B0JPS4_DROGU|nr:uncharacterized protein LOC117592537 isoform X1 [Drosophila guanche]SPP75346.1 blast:Transposable element Tc3 transposase [Drosophila guanche]